MTKKTNVENIMKNLVFKICKTHANVNVFATDAIISTLMCCTRSVYPWDIVVDVNLIEHFVLTIH